MTIEQFAEITRRIIEKDGSAAFLPTVLYPRRSEIVALDELPINADTVALAIEWASSRAEAEEEFLLAVPVTPVLFVVIHRHNGALQTREFGLRPPAVNER